MFMQGKRSIPPSVNQDAKQNPCQPSGSSRQRNNKCLVSLSSLGLLSHLRSPLVRWASPRVNSNAKWSFSMFVVQAFVQRGCCCWYKCSPLIMNGNIYQNQHWFADTKIVHSPPCAFTAELINTLVDKFCVKSLESEKKLFCNRQCG